MTAGENNTTSIPASGMPFIEDDLLWCPDNDTKMVDISQCLENGGGLGELSHSDLSGLETGLEQGEDEDIFKQLSDTSFELEQFFDFSNDVKEENNNSISSSNKNPATVALLHELQKNASYSGRKLNIAAANPLLAEKLSSPSVASGCKNNGQMFQNSSIPNRIIKSEPGTLQNRTEKLLRNTSPRLSTSNSRSHEIIFSGTKKYVGNGECDKFKVRLQYLFHTYCIPDIRLILKCYRSFYKGGIEEAIKAAMKDAEADAYIALTLSIEDRYKYFASLLKASVDGIGTDEDRIHRIVLNTCETYLGDILDEYKCMYDKKFSKRIEGFKGEFGSQPHYVKALKYLLNDCDD